MLRRGRANIITAHVGAYRLSGAVMAILGLGDCIWAGVWTWSEEKGDSR